MKDEIERFLEQSSSLPHPTQWQGKWTRLIRLAFFKDAARGHVGLIYLALTIMKDCEGVPIEVDCIIPTVISSN